MAGLVQWVGRRVVVRYRLPDGRASDAVGTLQSVGERSCIVLRDRVPPGEAGAPVEVALDAVLLAKPVPPPPVRRASRSAGG